MSERDDIAGLAFLVGGAINDIKKTTVDDGKYISQSLPDPASFVKQVIAQDLTPAIAQAKMEALKQEGGANPQPPQPVPETIKATQSASSEEVALMVSILRDIHTELKKITAKFEEKYV